MNFQCPPELELMSDIVYGPTRTRAHLLDVLRPRSSASKPVPAILFLHGGGWQMFGKYPEINVFLAQAGFVTASSNYRYSSEATSRRNSRMPGPPSAGYEQTLMPWVLIHTGLASGAFPQVGILPPFLVHKAKCRPWWTCAARWIFLIRRTAWNLRTPTAR